MTAELPHRDWPLRPWLTAGLLAAAGLLVYSANGENGLDTTVPWRAALVAASIVGPLAFAFTFDRGRWKEPLIFAIAAALVMGGLAWRTTAADGHYASPEFGFMAGLVATALALPLMQAGFHRTRSATPYHALHEAAWTDAICAAGSLAFTGASWLLLLLLSQLFHLLKIDLIQDVMSEAWFGWMFSGAAFGAALGVLRGQLAILGTLQRVVMVVLSILAVPLAAGLALFIAAMIVSGPDVLWQATRSATPILLACAAGSWLLANAIVRDSDDDASGSRVLRVAALALVVLVLPLTVFAAVSLGTRIAQHGLSPERIWAGIAIAVACAYGLAWFVAAIRGWRGDAWMQRVRSANVHLAVGVCALALLLALPVLDFGAISARNQVARLERGAVSAEDFDYAALRWDFGDAGRRALARLARSGNPAIARAARDTQALAERSYRGIGTPSLDSGKIRWEFADPALRARVLSYLRIMPWPCETYCVVLDLGAGERGARRFAIVSGATAQVWKLDPRGVPVPQAAPSVAASVKDGSRIEVGTVTRRYILVDGRPVGEPIPD